MSRNSINMTRTVKVAAVLALIALGALACGQPLTTAEETQTAQAVAASPTATVVVRTAMAVAGTGTPVVAETPILGLTDTGYKAADGSPLYAECIGPDPVSVAQGTPAAAAKLPLPPAYPTAAGSPIPAPSPPANPNPNPKPPDSELPSFDVLTVAAADSTAWPRASTACLGGLSFNVPPDWRAIGAFAVAGYQQGAGAQYVTADSKTKIQIDYMFERSDAMAGFRNGSPGNGAYRLVQPTPTTVGGAPALVQVSSEIVGSPTRYVVISYVANPRPDWYVNVTVFLNQPYQRSSIADFRALLESLRFAP